MPSAAPTRRTEAKREESCKEAPTSLCALARNDVLRNRLHQQQWHAPACPTSCAVHTVPTSPIPRMQCTRPAPLTTPLCTSLCTYLHLLAPLCTPLHPFAPLAPVHMDPPYLCLAPTYRLSYASHALRPTARLVATSLHPFEPLCTSNGTSLTSYCTYFYLSMHPHVPLPHDDVPPLLRLACNVPVPHLFAPLRTSNGTSWSSAYL